MTVTIAVAVGRRGAEGVRDRARRWRTACVLARDLVNEPANVLYPVEFARRASELEKLGVDVEVFDVEEMTKLEMNALLGVGQGSVHESRMVIMRWNGGKRDDKPIAFIGKGVCFDTGGVSIKPASGMEDMKGDMAGAACVVGLMHALAARKAKVNVVGAIGLVENAVDGKAQRPGDIVTTMSGQTIEIINTDAEGRLVLADVLHYVNKRFKPKFMLDLATLTGAIIVALGQEYAGLFSNDDKLAERLVKVGKETGERVWRDAARARIRQDDRFEVRRHEEHRRPPWRLDHRGAIAAALRRQDAVGASRHRRHRDGLAADRHQPELGLGLRRAAARPAGGGILRALRPTRGRRPMTELLFYHLQHQPLEKVLPALLEKSLERGWRVAVQARRRSGSRRSMRICGPIATTASCRMAPGAMPERRSSRSCSPSTTTIRTAPTCASCSTARAVPADAEGYERIVLMFDGEDPDAVAVARARWGEAKVARLRGDLLAAGRRRPLAAQGLIVTRSFGARASLRNKRNSGLSPGASSRSWPGLRRSSVLSLSTWRRPGPCPCRTWPSRSGSSDRRARCTRTS